MSSWSVVSTVNEEPEVLASFVNHHLNHGCSLIHLYFDNALDPAKELFDNHPKVVVEDSVQGVGSHEKKQSLNATDAYKKCQSHWLAHVDADEFIYSDVGVENTLRNLGDEVMQLNLLPWEGVFATLDDAQKPFSTELFRGRLRPIKDAILLQDQFYPKAGNSMKWGLTGHSAGKSFVRRTTAQMKARIHFWQYKQSEKTINSHSADNEIRLLHFDAISFSQWKRKFLKRLNMEVIMKGMDPHRLSQLQAFEERLRPGAGASIEELFKTLYVLSPETLRRTESGKFIKMFKWMQGGPPTL